MMFHFFKKIQRISCYILIFFLLIASQSYAQERTVKGKVYAFKDLPLDNIQILSRKTNNVCQTDSSGNFQISCELKDKLIFTGKGFQNTSIKTESLNPSVVKMIFNETKRAKQLAIENKHVNQEELARCIQFQSSYNNPNYNSTTFGYLPFQQRYLKRIQLTNYEAYYSSSNISNNTFYQQKWEHK